MKCLFQDNNNGQIIMSVNSAHYINFTLQFVGTDKVILTAASEMDLMNK